jgi:ferrous iron transport protein A
METTLDKSPAGREALIKEVSSEGLGVRLMELGLTPGVEVQVLFKAPGGCPIAVGIGNGYILGLRVEEAELVTVYLTKHQDHDHLRN